MGKMCRVTRPETPTGALLEFASIGALRTLAIDRKNFANVRY